MFIIPWHKATVIGTTDTDYDGDLANVFASREDVEYLLTAVRHHFPQMKATAKDVIGTWAGLRPLLHNEGVAESQVSREHHIHVDPRGIVTIAGGKLTTYRLMAQECLEAVKTYLGRDLPTSTTGHTPLPYRGNVLDEASREGAIARLKSGRGLPEDIARHLVCTYGAKSDALLDLGTDAPILAQRLDPKWPCTGLEIAWAAREEMALTLIDAMCRRTPIFFLLGDRLEPAARKAAAIMAAELGWDQARTESEVAETLRYQDLHMACVR